MKNRPMSWHFHPSEEEKRLSDHNQLLHTRFKVGNVMTCANFGVNIPRDVHSGGCTKLGFPLLHGLTLQLQRKRAAVITEASESKGVGLGLTLAICPKFIGSTLSAMINRA